MNPARRRRDQESVRRGPVASRASRRSGLDAGVTMHATRLKAAAFASLLAAAVFAGVAASRGAAQDAPAAPSAALARTRAVAAASDAFLATLGPDQRRRVLLPFTVQAKAEGIGFSGLGPRPRGRGRLGGPGGPPSDGRGAPPGGLAGGPPGGMKAAEKYGAAIWSNFPEGIVARPGLQLGGLSPAQRAAAMHLLQVLLSPAGYGKVQDIMSADQVLADAGQDFPAGRDVYSLAILGAPDVAKPWMVEFGGHHLGLNVVIVGAHGVMTPTLTGTQPAAYTVAGRTVRVLAGENDKAFALLEALDAGQRQRAVLNYRIGDLVLGPGHDGETLAPEGLRASAMTERQKTLLLDLVAEWAGIVDAAYAGPRLAEIRAGLNDTWFAWSGPTTHAPNKNGSAYYRIQGPKLVIEFAPQTSRGDDPTTHVHTVYRDPTNAYGAAFTHS